MLLQKHGKLMDKDIFMDIIDIPETPNVPKFEKDLRKAGGDISALAKEKEPQKNVSFDEIDTSSLNFEEELPQQPEPDKSEADEAAIDFIYDEDSFSGNLDELSADSIQLDDMYEKTEIKLAALSAGKRVKSGSATEKPEEKLPSAPKTEDMSRDYAPNAKKNEEFAQKDMLDDSEKEFIRNRLKTEMESKPEGYDQKKSLEMYRQLMAEQKEKQAQHGFAMLILTAVFGLLAAAATFALYIKAPEACGKLPSLNIFAIGAVIFSAGMLLKAKFFKVFSILFFIVNTVALAVPGLIGYISSGASSSDGFAVNVVLYAAAVIFSAVAAIRLVAVKDISAYYNYKPEKDLSHRG